MRFPETEAGGYSRVDGTVAFYARVQALIDEFDQPVTILDFGAGRGASDEDPVPFRRRLQTLKGDGRIVYGVDVDEAVLDNPRLDHAWVIDPVSGRTPLEDASVDVIVSDFTLEHIEDAAMVAREMDRVLRPGGWLCARTPNKWGYIALGARLVPNRLHVAALHKLQPSKAEHDTFPTRYQLNTVADFERHFPAPDFSVHAYAADAEPHLYAGSSGLIAVVLGALRWLPERFRSMLYVYVHKRR